MCKGILEEEFLTPLTALRAGAQGETYLLRLDAHHRLKGTDLQVEQLDNAA